MANHKSAIKRNRQNIVRRDRNRVARLTMRTVLKKARVAIETGQKDAADLVKQAEKALSSAATKGLVHKKNASRRIGRLNSALHKKTTAKK